MTNDEHRLAEISTALADGLERTLTPWLVAQLHTRLSDPMLAERIAETAGSVAAAINADVRRLLETDIDEQRANPLAIVRAGLGPATDLLRELDVVPPQRDPFVEQALPSDVYDLAPAAFIDIDESLHEPGLMWGAAKAHVHISRRKAEGLR